MQLLKKLVNRLFLSESATGSLSVEGLVSSPSVVGAQRALKGMLYLWHQSAWPQTASTKQIRSASWRASGLLLLSKQVIDADPPHTPPPQNAAEDPLTPSYHGLRILHPDNLSARQGKLEVRLSFRKCIGKGTGKSTGGKSSTASKRLSRPLEQLEGGVPEVHFSDALVPGKICGETC